EARRQGRDASPASGGGLGSGGGVQHALPAGPDARPSAQAGRGPRAPAPSDHGTGRGLPSAGRGLNPNRLWLDPRRGGAFAGRRSRRFYFPDPSRQVKPVVRLVCVLVSSKVSSQRALISTRTATWSFLPKKKREPAASS